MDFILSFFRRNGDDRHPMGDVDPEKQEQDAQVNQGPPTSEEAPTDHNRPNPQRGLRDRFLRSREQETVPEGFRGEAKIWKLYLEAAGTNASEKAKLWDTGLEAQMVFAGLFAGVISGFVIDIRSELQPDRAPRLLSDILDFLRNAPTSDTSSGTPDSVYWVHGLWIISLFTTILSAILGVLAKSWLAKYTPDPTSSRATARDAYERYKLERQAERLPLKEVLTLAPLLIQFASFLFLAGLIIQSLGDVPPLGRTLLCLCLASAVGYLFLTISHLVRPSFIFNTPVSDLLLTAFTPRSNRQGGSESGTSFPDTLRDIMFDELIVSCEPTLVDAVVEEVALNSFKHEWIELLCKGDIPNILVSRFWDCAASKTMDTVQMGDTLSNHLLVLLSLVEAHEQRRGKGKEIDEAFQGFLEPGELSHRFNTLSAARVRLLLFALRASVLLLGSPKGQPSDFTDKELADRPWEVAFQEAPTVQRLNFTLACCRGLAQGDKNLKKISSFALCLSLAKASSMVSVAIEWGEKVTLEQQQGVRNWVIGCLEHLYEATVSGWEDMTPGALRATSSLEIPMGVIESIAKAKVATVPKLLLLSLTQTDRTLRAHTFKMLTHWIRSSTSNRGHPAPIGELGTDELGRIMDIAIVSDRLMREGVLKLFAEFIKVADGKVCETIKTALVDSILSRLKKDRSSRARMSIIRFIANLPMRLTSNNPGLFFPVLTEVIESCHDLVADLVEGGLTVDHVQKAMAEDSTLGPSNGPSTTALKNAMLRHLSQIFDERADAITKKAEALKKELRALEKEAEALKKETEALRKEAGAFGGKTDSRALKKESEALKEEAEALKKEAEALRRKTDSEALDERTGSGALKEAEAIADKTDSTALVDFLVNLAKVIEACALGKEILGWGCSPWGFMPAKERPAWTFPWARDRPSDFVREFLDHRSTTEAPSETMFAKLVEAATGDPRSDIFTPAQRVLTLLCRSEPSYLSVLKNYMPSDLSIVLRHPTPQDAGPTAQDADPTFQDADPTSRNVRWAKFLVSMLPELELKLRAQVTGYLQQTATSVKATIYTHTNEKDARAGQGVTRTATGYDTGSLTEKPGRSPGILNLLRACQGGVRIRWLRVFCAIAETYPQDFPDALDFLAETIVSFETYYDVREVAIEGLVSLGRQALNFPDVRGGVLTALAQLSSANGWRVRAALPRLLAEMGASTAKLQFTGDVLAILRRMALGDGDRDIRSYAIKILSLSGGIEGQNLVQSDADKTAKSAAVTNLGMFQEGIKDKDPLPRQCWLKFVVPYINDAASPSDVTSILNLTIQDDNGLVRAEASHVTCQLLQELTCADGAEKLGSPFASHVGDFIGRAIKPKPKDPKAHTSAASLLVRLTSTARGAGSLSDENLAPPSTLDDKLYPLEEWNDTLLLGHDAWVRLVMFLGRHGFTEVPQIIKAAIEDERMKRFQDVSEALDGVELLSQIQSALPHYLYSALRNGTDVYHRLEAVNLLASLLFASDSAYGLLGGPKNTHPDLMSQLAREVSASDARLRERAMKLVKVLLTNGRFRDCISSYCSERIGACLSDQGTPKDKANATWILSELTTADAIRASTSNMVGPSPMGPSQETSDDAYTPLNDIISPHLSLLLKFTLLVDDRARQEERRKYAHDILLKNLKTYPGGRPLNEDVLAAIPPIMHAIPVAGKSIALDIVDALPISAEKALLVAHELVLPLRDPSSVCRALALELLSRLYHRYNLNNLAGSATQEVIVLALKDSANEIRIAAIQLLTALVTPPQVVLPNGNPAEPPVKPTVELATQFAALLPNENLRPSVVELLSAMARGPTVRTAISLQIMASFFGSNDASHMQGHTELLARLISHGRFVDEAMDKVMLFFASAMVTKPELTQYRFEVLTSLWCRYATEKGRVISPRKQATPPERDQLGQATTSAPQSEVEPEPNEISTEQLISWFTCAMFGKYASKPEVERVLARSKLWLPKIHLPSAEATTGSPPSAPAPAPSAA